MVRSMTGQSLTVELSRLPVERIRRWPSDEPGIPPPNCPDGQETSLG